MATKKTLLILGATSAIAQQVARQVVSRDYRIILVGRDRQKLVDLCADLQVRGGTADYRVHDLLEMTAHEQIIKNVVNEYGGFDIVLLAYGTLPDQEQCEADRNEAVKQLNINFISAQNILSVIAERFIEQGQGQIIAISSVAGDRGRKSNYIYGAAKGALSIYLQGLRNRLSAHNVQVLTVKPGFVDTPMTKDFKKGILWSTPERVAKDIVRAMDKRRDVIYTPWFWKYIMLIIKFIPETIFKKLNL